MEPVELRRPAPWWGKRGLTSALTGEAALLAGLTAGFLINGMAVAALGCLAFAVLSAGLATSIAEGFPTPGAAVVALQGTGVAVALLRVSSVAALLVAALTTVGVVVATRRRLDQMRRPVPAQ